MSDGEVEVEQSPNYNVLPKDVVENIGQTKLFNKWSYEDVEIRDISLTYVGQTPPHTHTPCEMGDAMGQWAIAEGKLTGTSQRLHSDQTASLHLPLGWPIRCEALPQGTMPHH